MQSSTDPHTLGVAAHGSTKNLCKGTLNNAADLYTETEVEQDLTHQTLYLMVTGRFFHKPFFSSHELEQDQERDRNRRTAAKL